MGRADRTSALCAEHGHQSASAGPPKVVGLPGIKSVVFSAEHGIITLEAPNESLRIGDVLDLVVGYSDATVCLHDQLYGIRDGVVEAVWPILGRGKLR
jgi:D-serine deaminase-like pyridoxal phosphate-dependent protein